MRHFHAAFVTAGLLALCAGQLPAQTVEIATPTLIVKGERGRQPYEPYVAIDPLRPAHILVATIVSGPGNLPFNTRVLQHSCAAFLSTDGGSTWARHDFATSECFDPWIVFTPAGNAVVSLSTGHQAFRQQGSSGLVLFRSPDGGATWDSVPTPGGSDFDHPVMAIDASNGPRSGWIYLTTHRPMRADDGMRRWGVYLVRSRDGGKTLDDPVSVIPNNLHNLAEIPVVLRDGTVIVSFVDASYSADTGGTARASIAVARRRAWIARSTDGGFTFSIPLFVTDACGPPPGYRLSALAVDRSTGPFADRLYFACRQQGGGPIVVGPSRVRGETWMSPESVTAASSPPNVAERVPTIAVNDSGTVMVAWIDAPGPPSRCVQTLFVAASRDGGRTFTPGQKVSSASQCADSTFVVSTTGGDYFGLTAERDGRFRLVWSEIRDGDSHVLTTTVAVRR
jgi:hypothetical protein